MPSALLTSKGQLTLPKKIREQLSLHAGDRLRFRVIEGRKILMEAETIDPLRLVGFLKAPKKRRISVQDMEKVIQKRGRI